MNIYFIERLVVLLCRAHSDLIHMNFLIRRSEMTIGHFHSTGLSFYGSLDNWWVTGLRDGQAVVLDAFDRIA